MPHLTLFVDAELLKRAQKIATERNTILSEMILEYLRNEIDATDLTRLLSDSPMVVGEKRWTREHLHKR